MDFMWSSKCRRYGTKLGYFQFLDNTWVNPLLLPKFSFFHLQDRKINSFHIIYFWWNLREHLNSIGCFCNVFICCISSIFVWKKKTLYCMMIGKSICSLCIWRLVKNFLMNKYITTFLSEIYIYIYKCSLGVARPTHLGSTLYYCVGT